MAKDKYAKEFMAMMDEFHSENEPRDRELDALIHRQYYEVLSTEPDIDYSVPYFSPSSSDSDMRELYHKVMRDIRDSQKRQPHQGRWVRIGTATGDVIQRDLLFIEKHYEDMFGKRPAFIPERTEAGYPAWEDFIYGQHPISHRGHDFSLVGTSDGIIVHQDGTRIGLEIKSKQTTSARTSAYSMKEPEAKHIKQCVVYAIMYGLDKYLISYVNLSKKSWSLTPEEYAKTPDMRVFEIDITDKMKLEALDYFADVMDAVESETPPPMDLSKWTFNDFKTEIATSLSDLEFDAMRSQVKTAMVSGMPEYLKKQYFEAFEFIRDIRAAVSEDGD